MLDYLFFAFNGGPWLNTPAAHSAVAIGAILLALIFDFVNGFHDTANACATVIYTKAVKPNIAIIGAGLLNFLGALLVGTAVAQVITKIIPANTVTLSVVVAVLIAAVIWNLLTWWLSLPVSSSHCLIGSLFGAGIMAAGVNGVAWPELNKVLAALIISPICGFAAGAIFTWLGMKLNGINSTTTITEIKQTEFITANTSSTISTNGSKTSDNAFINDSQLSVIIETKQPPLMRWLHILSSSLVAFSHGGNDGQKTMGIITLILATHFSSNGYKLNEVPFWVVLACAAAIGLGTTIGGWRVIKTVGEKISKEPITHSQGFGASTATALVITLASRIGAPISTTHTLSSAVAGGILPAHGPTKFNIDTLKSIAMAWVLTIPITAALAAISYIFTKMILG